MRALAPLFGVLRGRAARAIHARQFQEVCDVPDPFSFTGEGEPYRGAGRSSRPPPPTTCKPCPVLPFPRPLFVQLLHAKTAHLSIALAIPNVVFVMCSARRRPLRESNEVEQTGPRSMHARRIVIFAISRAHVLTVSCLYLLLTPPPPSPLPRSLSTSHRLLATLLLCPRRPR